MTGTAPQAKPEPGGVKRDRSIIVSQFPAFLQQDGVGALAGLTRFEPPTLAAPAWQLCTESQIHEARYAHWCAEIREHPRPHRKQWEFCYVLEVLEQQGCLQPGRRGLGFGVGHEPLPAVMAARGCAVVATDLPHEQAHAKGWAATDQHGRDLDYLNDRQICPPDLFRTQVELRYLDMNNVPYDLQNFSFVWSCCALEHLGSLAHGLSFVERSVACLEPGGIAVHTTEFNLASNQDTLDSEGTAIYRRRDMEALADRLIKKGHRIWPLNFHPGEGPLDRHVDVPPYSSDTHLKLAVAGHHCSSFGMIVQRRY